MPEAGRSRLAHSLDDVRPLHQLCREGRFYDVERWIADGKPLQMAPEAIPKGARPKTALQIALETGQHSLAILLLQNGYRLELERYAPLDLALQSRRWDLFDLLLDWGGDLRSVDVYAVLNTYNADPRAAEGLLGTRAKRGQRQEAVPAGAEDEACIGMTIDRDEARSLNTFPPTPWSYLRL
jgi:hypothetical protein